MRKTSEEILGFVKQPQVSCPTIDKIIAKLDYIGISNFAKENLIKDLEFIRKNCADIREWGQDWKTDHLRNLEVYDGDLFHKIQMQRAKEQWSKIKDIA